MKTLRRLATVLIALALTPAFAQPQPAPPAAPMPLPARQIHFPGDAPEPAKSPELTKFSLDFPGGTARELVAAIQKAMGKPLNVIIPEEHAQVKLPPLKMSNVDILELFTALENLGKGDPPGLSYWFITEGKRSDQSVWTFYAFNRVVHLEKVCRFYSLAPYLERGLTVDDITTAIQTGWKMLGDKDTPTINYHKDTKLLIAVGEPSKLETIDAVLMALTPPPPPEKKPEAKPVEKKAEK